MNVKRLTYFSLLGLVSLQFGIVGLLKSIGFAPLYQQLAELHIAPGLGLLIGVLEVLGVIGLWIRPVRRAALLGLLLLAVCAIAVHFGAGVALYKAVPALVATGILTTLVYLTNPTSVKRLLDTECA